MPCSMPLLASPGDDQPQSQVVSPDRERLRFDSIGSLQCYEALFELAADAILLGDPQGDIVDANHSATVLTGYDHAELIGLNIARLFSSSEQARNPLRYDLLRAGQVVRQERTLTLQYLRVEYRGQSKIIDLRKSRAVLS